MIESSRPIEWWQQTAFKQWQEAIVNDTIPHASLVCGAKGLGKGSLVRSIVTELLCKQPVEEGACGGCQSCVGIVSDTHPDVKCLVPEAPGKAIKIDDIRDAIEWLQLSPLQSIRKVFIIEDADHLNTAASNALLKVLEEPPSTSVIFLITDRPSYLKATIRSRCQHLMVPMPDAAFIRAWIKNKIPQGSKVLPLFPGLGPFALLEEYEEDQTQVRELCFQILDAVEHHSLDFVSAQEKLKGVDPSEVLRYFHYYLYHANGQALLHDNHSRMKAILALETQWVEMKENLIYGKNLNWPLQLEIFFNQLSNLHAAS